MFLKRLKLKSYRNYEKFDFEFSKNKTLFVGKNAQGKTNLLEAAYYLSSLDSNRIKKDKELIMMNIETEMKEAAKNLDFERAMELRDILFEMKSE